MRAKNPLFADKFTSSQASSHEVLILDSDAYY